MRLAASAPAARQRGLTLVEILVATALSLLLVTAIALVVAGHLAGQRRQLADMRLAQDLRAALELIVRDLRRAGLDEGPPVRGGDPGGSSTAHAGDLAALWPPSPSQPPPPAADAVGYAYRHDDGHGPGVTYPGFRLNPRTQAIDMRMAGSSAAPADTDHWQPLTDPQALRVTRFAVQPVVHTASLLDHCARPVCPAGAAACPPMLEVRLIRVEIDATDARDAAVTRTLAAQVRVRADRLAGSCPS